MAEMRGEKQLVLINLSFVVNIMVTTSVELAG